MLKIFLSVLAFVSLNASAQAPFQKRLPLVDRYLDSFMKVWNIPGMAVGIVYKDQLIYSKGFGYRDLEKKLPVNAATIFPIASNTKLFTATLACMMHAERTLDLDKPVRFQMPSLQFNNDDLNATVTLRDMLSHRTGLPRYDGIWAGDTGSRSSAVYKIVHMKPQLGLREGYIYNNMMYAAAGAVMENLTGQSWETLVKDRLLTPLGMHHTVFSYTELQDASNTAHSYFPDSLGKHRRIEYVAQSDALGPAGTIKSNLLDMSRWMIAQLNNGMLEGRQVIPEWAIKQILVPNMIADREGRWEEMSNTLYGLGRWMAMYKGHKITGHTGSIDGFYSNLSFIPSQQLGIFLVHNGRSAGFFRTAMSFPLIDRLLQLDYTPWNERYREEFLKTESSRKLALDSLHLTRVQGTQPSHPLDAFAGTYTNPIYGALTIEKKEEGLWLHFRRQHLKLEHFHYDQFITNVAEYTGEPNFELQFMTNAKGEIDKITMRPFGDPEASFIKN